MNKICSVVASFCVISILQYSVPTKAVTPIGTHQCGSDSVRGVGVPQPPVNLTAANLDVSESGYVLSVVFDDERGNHELLLDNELSLIAAPITLGKLQISPDGQFSMNVMRSAFLCTFQGIAEISPEATSKLFGTNSSQVVSTSIRNGAAPRSGFTRLSTDAYIIDYPEDWLVRDSSQQYASIWNQPPSRDFMFPPDFVKTEIHISAVKFEEASRRLLDTENARYDRGVLTRKGELTVGGREAFRVWFENGENTEDSIITIIKYSDTQTATVSSYLTGGETWAISTVQDIHWSFRVK